MFFNVHETCFKRAGLLLMERICPMGSILLLMERICPMGSIFFPLIAALIRINKNLEGH